MDLQCGQRIVLASASPRRRLIFANAGFEVEIEPAVVDETVAPEKPPAAAVRELALRKAEKIAVRYPDRVVVGADTLVWLGNEILEKPLDRRDACSMLYKLQGQWHSVFTGFAIIKLQENVRLVLAEETRVKFLSLTRDFIEHYVDGGEPMDKAGAYGIQEQGSLMVEQIKGCYFNVMGFPIAAFYREYRRLFGSVNS